MEVLLTYSYEGHTSSDLELVSNLSIEAFLAAFK